MVAAHTTTIPQPSKVTKFLNKRHKVNIMKKLLFTLISVLGLSLLAPASAFADISGNGSPTDFVQDNATQVLEMLKQDNGQNNRKIRDDIEKLVLPKFDFRRMTAYAVGKNWRSATSDQQTQLIKQFQTLLVRVYASTMTRYKTAQIKVTPNADFSNNDTEAVVHSKVTLPSSGGNQQPVSVDYALYKTSQGWRVYNISVEGASLVTAYRNQFDTEVRANGIDGLIKSLAEKNDKLLAQGS